MSLDLWLAIPSAGFLAAFLVYALVRPELF